MRINAFFFCSTHDSIVVITKVKVTTNRSDIIVVGIFIRSKFEFRLKLYLSAFAITKTPKF